ncbi:unnamed protein product [Schistosoma mattheei]|uniref:Uncharacterized protein n=1 Tax=Schistosoma mattheei TaxID=31246 RepID=A0A3P8EDP4_9TREM|nr:unnamed protein product [Schistosoma mattheei]
MKRGRATGPDGLAPEVIKYGGPVLATRSNCLNMDTSMEDLFSDFDKSTVLVETDAIYPFVYIGTTSGRDHSDGITSSSQILAKILVDMVAKTEPPYLMTSGANPSRPVALPRFRLATSIIHSGYLGMKNNTEKHDLMVLATETIGNETIRIEGVHQASTQSLCLTIELHENSLLSSCINLEIPYQYPSSSTNLSETKNIPVHICTLCDKNHFMNIITYPQHQTSTVFADLSFTSSSSSSIFTCSKRFINILCDIKNEDIRCDPHLVRLCSLPNGLVYAIWYTTMNKKLHCSVAFPLSCCKPIVTWAFIRNPAANSTLSRIIDNTLADNRCTQIENNTVNDLLIGLTKDGEGVGVWFDSSDVCNKKLVLICLFPNSRRNFG